MKLLIDSNAFIWMFTRPAELSAIARQTLENAENERFVSIASIWEITIKVSIGKLVLPGKLDAAMHGIAAVSLPITLAHIDRIQSLPFHHRDPFDRMLIAQAMEEGMTVVTRDRHFASYGVPLLKA